MIFTHHIRSRFALTIGLLLIAGALWTWFGTPPPLSNANAPGATLANAKSALDQRVVEREIAVRNAAVLDGARGDFEKRGVALRDLTPDQRQIEVQNLIADVGLIQQATRASEQERAALKAYDDALMGRTRDLGAIAETLRDDTWAIVEHLKLYPPPLGLRADWQPATADFFATRIITLTNGTLDQQINATIEIGRSTFSVRQLRDLDATYRAELDRYAAKLDAVVAANDHKPTTTRQLLGLLITLLVIAVLWLAISMIAQPDWFMLAGVISVIGWYLLPVPFAFIFALSLIALIALRPALAGMLPLLAIPVYFRPRVIGDLRFPLNETLFGLIVAGLGLYLILQWRNGWRPQFSQFVARHRALLLIMLGWLIAAGMSLFAPPLVERAVAMRELRRTIIEPLIWALIVAWLLDRGLLTRRAMLWAFMLSAGWIAGDGLIRFALGEGVWATESVPRLIGLLPSSTAMGVYVGAALATTLAFVFSDDPDRHAAFMLAIPLSLAVFLTFTRGAWLGVSIALVAILLIQRRWKIMLGLVSVAGVGLISVALIRPTLLARVFRLGEGTGTARREIWASAINAIRDSPFFGLGLDQFSHVDAARYGIPQLRFLTLSHPHNLILDVWTQLGLLGMIVMLTWLIVTFTRTWRNRQSVIALAMFALMLDLLIHGMLDQTMLGGDMIWLWWMLLQNIEQRAKNMDFSG